MAIPYETFWQQWLRSDELNQLKLVESLPWEWKKIRKYGITPTWVNGYFEDLRDATIDKEQEFEKYSRDELIIEQ
jgi:hypothetical protein